MRRHVEQTLCLALLVVAHPRTADCTQARRLDPGARLRFDVPSMGDRMTGTLVRWTADTLVVSVDGDAPGLALMVPTDSVARIDLQQEQAMTMEGAGLGALAGVLLAVVASPDWVDDEGNCTIACLAYEVSPNVDTRIAVLGLTGAVLGVVVGSGAKRVTWITVHLQRSTVGATSDGGLAFGLRIRF
ncbi:MAG TPA: hypothetical protein VFO67_04815 [Gemmatimonadales bacterium]|nr:hypothetical protein [Gemmatimonadales bacterium]